jgi:hypothetical protein
MEGKSSRRLGFAALLALVLFCLNRGCSAVNASPSWVAGTAWFTAATVLLVIVIWLWDHTSTRHWVIKLTCSVFVVAVIAIAGYGPIMDQYSIEHAPPSTPSAAVPLVAEQLRNQVARVPMTMHKPTPTAQSATQVVNNCPNGICGQEVNNSTVNNYAPPQRSLSDEQKTRFIALLKPACPFEVAVRHIPGNSESQQYADQLGEAITEAGCMLRKPRFLIDEHNGYGLIVALHDKENIPPAADALIGALLGANIKAVSSTADSIETGVVYLFVELSDLKKP